MEQRGGPWEQGTHKKPVIPMTGEYWPFFFPLDEKNIATQKKTVNLESDKKDFRGSITLASYLEIFFLLPRWRKTKLRIKFQTNRLWQQKIQLRNDSKKEWKMEYLGPERISNFGAQWKISRKKQFGFQQSPPQPERCCLQTDDAACSNEQFRHDVP